MSLSKVVKQLSQEADLVVTLNEASEAESDIIYYGRNFSVFKVMIFILNKCRIKVCLSM